MKLPFVIMSRKRFEELAKRNDTPRDQKTGRFVKVGK